MTRLAVFLFLVGFQPSLLVPSDLISRPPKWVALTFDDGPHPAPTWRIQKILREHNVPATFFVVGKIAERHPNVVRSLVRDGHEIANHSWSHPDIHVLPPDAMEREFRRTRELIHRITGRDTALFRTPGSTRHYLLNKFRIPAGFRLVLWDIHAMDHRPTGVDEIHRRILNDIRPGHIVLLHNGRPETAEALATLLPELKKRGYGFTTVSQLLDRRPAPHRSVMAG